MGCRAVRTKLNHAGAWRPDWEARFARLLRDGLEGRLQVVLGGGEPGERLLMIRIHPHRPPSEWAPRYGVARLQAGLEDYHISIAYENELRGTELQDITAAWDGVVTRVVFTAGPTRGGTLYVGGELADDPNIQEAHARGWYGNRPLHVSF